MRNNPELLELLCCPKCNCGLVLDGSPVQDGHILEGQLVCNTCSQAYPIVKGVPRFHPEILTDDEENTVAGFGNQWQKTVRLKMSRFLSPVIFFDFIAPLKEDVFRGKIVLDAGCGSGRFTEILLSHGAAIVVGVDLSSSVEVAFEATRQYENALIIQASLFELPVHSIFDYILSIGVLHHTPNPKEAFGSIASTLKRGGAISVWVYGRENNDWIINILNPLREKITSRLPRNVLWSLSYLFAMVMYLPLKLIYKPAGQILALKWTRKILFYFDYMYFMSQFNFDEIALIVFDHLVPTLSHYISLEELKMWFESNLMNNIRITPRNNNSWRGYGIKFYQENRHV